jgi:hypothetical protein
VSQFFFVDSHSGETLLALPDGIKLHDRPTGYRKSKTTILDNSITHLLFSIESTAIDPPHIQEYVKTNVAFMKAQLAEALKRYEQV